MATKPTEKIEKKTGSAPSYWCLVGDDPEAILLADAELQDVGAREMVRIFATEEAALTESALLHRNRIERELQVKRAKLKVHRQRMAVAKETGRTPVTGEDGRFLYLSASA